eukprot:Gb_28872 [translate_table: standard]
MEAHHASLGRRKLEEIRQKKAADRSQKVSTGMDPMSTYSPGLQKTSSGMEESASWIGYQSIEREFQALSTYSKQLEAKIAEQQEQNQIFASKLDTLETERNSLQKQLKNMEENELPSLKKALQDVSMEKDAAIVAREDLSAQLRAVKKRLREVEEEQYKAEEDAAALRAEVNMLQRQEEQQQNSNLPSSTITPEHFRAMEQEMANMKVQLQEALRLRQQEQQRLAEEKERFTLLVTEKELLQEKLEVATKKSLEPASEQAGEGNSSTAENKKHEKGKHDQQLRDLALMVERLENGRQKIIAEIDAQSLEIERLFVENASLSDGLKEMTGVAAQWESQVQECLKQNAELRVMLDKLRTERVNTVSAPSLYNEDAKLTKEITEENLSGINGNGVYATENSKLKAELAKTQTKAETLAAQVMQLSVELKHTVQAYNGLTRLYNPVLWNIENRLIQMKADSFVSDAVL